MPVLATKLSTRSEDFVANAAAMLGRLWGDDGAANAPHQADDTPALIERSA